MFSNLLLTHTETQERDRIAPQLRWLSATWSRLFDVVVVLAIGVLLFHNLELNPRPWHDEGAALALSKTLVRDGVYAVRNSDGYQTFGPIQSVGPTVIVPVAVSFKLFGVGLLQGRLVAAAYALAALILYYCCGLKLFGRLSTLLSLLLFLGVANIGFFSVGRQVLGELPAFVFFISGWLLWASRRGRLKSILAGLLFGLAMITKTHYTVIVFGALGLLILLDLLYYRQGEAKWLLVTAMAALLPIAAWWFWQVAYFGWTVVLADASKLRQLASDTAGFDLRTAAEAVQYLFSGESNHLFFFWGLPALVYSGVLAARRNREGLLLMFLVLFAAAWLFYYVLWIVPWPGYLFACFAVVSLFVGRFLLDLLGAIPRSWSSLRTQIRLQQFNRAGLALVASLGIAFMVVYPLQRTIRLEVLAQDGSPNQLLGPGQAAAFLNETVKDSAVVETWERELSILTDHKYHFPDQSLLAGVQAAQHRGGVRNYQLGGEYFRVHQIRYLVIGWYARFSELYDPSFLAQHATLLRTIGDGEWRYEIYEIDRE